MVVTTILAYFLNNVFNSKDFSLKFWIYHPQGTSKIIQLFYFLSNYLVVISNIISVGERSLNFPSIPSRLIFVRFPLSHHYHPHHCHPGLLSTTCENHGKWPLTSLEVCGPNYERHTSLRNPDAVHPLLPFPEGCERRLLARWRIRSG